MMFSATFNEQNKNDIIKSNILQDPENPPYFLCQGESAFIKPNITHVSLYIGKELGLEEDFISKYIVLKDVLG